MFNMIDNIGKHSDANQIESLISTSLGKIKSMVDTSTVIGEPKNLIDGSVMIPISKVTFGYVGGGGEYGDETTNRKKNRERDKDRDKDRDSDEKNMPFAGGSGVALSMTPIGFLYGRDGKMELMKLDNETNLEKLIDLAGAYITKALKNNVKS